jgi:uncharacterized protein (DUF2147 family)
VPFPFHRIACFAASLVLLAAPIVPARQAMAQAPNDSPVGRWKTIDDHTGKVRSIVVIREQNGTLFGNVEALVDPPVPNPTCYLCSGDLKDRPLVGLQVLWGFTKDGDRWSGGHVLDPETGKIYSGWLLPEDGGKMLRLHGYIGISLIGRTEHWQRVE